MVDVCDLQGRSVASIKRFISEGQQNIIPLGRLKPGLYFYRVFANNSMQSGKFISFTN